MDVHVRPKEGTVSLYIEDLYPEDLKYLTKLLAMSDSPQMQAIAGTIKERMDPERTVTPKEKGFLNYVDALLWGRGKRN